MSYRHEDDPYYAPNVGAEGDSLYLGPLEAGVGRKLTREPYPVGATLGSHVWVTGDDGHGVWMTLAAFSELLAGPGSFSLQYLNGIDGATGDLVIITDGGTGNPVTALTPV